MDPVILYVYAYVVGELVLDTLAVFFAYRLTKITGSFRGWILVIIAVALFTFQNLVSLVETVLFFPVAQLLQLIQSIGTASFIFSSALGMALSLTLFLAMFELYRTFKRVTQDSKPQEPLAPSIN
jgi:hypothetical protein